MHSLTGQVLVDAHRPHHYPPKLDILQRKCLPRPPLSFILAPDSAPSGAESRMIQEQVGVLIGPPSPEVHLSLIRGGAEGQQKG